MDYGFSIPARGPLANRNGVDAMAKHGEKHGFAYLAVPDHIVVPTNISSVYPYSNSGNFPGAASGDALELFTVMAYLAAVTTSITLLSSIMVVPHRGAVHSAKILSTIDELSGGRLTVGVGAGWLEEEFEIIGAPPFAERGKVTDEYLAAIKALWIQDRPRFEGKYVQFTNVSFLPKPHQSPHPPIWVGGESEPALRRVIQHGDAWYPVGSNPRYPLNTRERYESAVKQLSQLAEVQGRDPATISLAYWANWYNESGAVFLDDGQRHLFTGNSEEIATDIRLFREIGVNHLLFNFQRDTLERSLESMDNFVENILPMAEE